LGYDKRKDYGGIAMKRKVNVWDYAGQIVQAMTPGILATTKAQGKVNTMTIGWGTLGIEWGRPVFILFVRESRYTKQMLDENSEFTINVPVGEIDKKIRAKELNRMQEISQYAINSAEALSNIFALNL
jgi:flavin reductase (DIM6/NTAB) family NADH-FMN oxidoreductase RutF